MNADKMGTSSVSTEDVRLTKVGKALRKYKLDELPQFFNVIKGEMSMVGPRPQVAWIVKLYTPQEEVVLQVKPGITDKASIKFHNQEELISGNPAPDKFYMEKIHPEKMRLALKYVNNYSFLNDLKIISLTFFTLVKTRIR